MLSRKLASVIRLRSISEVLLRSQTKAVSSKEAVQPQVTTKDEAESKSVAEKQIGSRVVSLVLKDDIAVIKINIPHAKENVINAMVAEALRNSMEHVISNDSIRGAVLISGKPNSFVAGADIGMLARMTFSKELKNSQAKNSEDARKISSDAQRDFLRIEKGEKPVVAAIMGTCMGGGLELALACHYRIAMNIPKTLFAFPEVKLGLLPGAGGTQRLPKLIPITEALGMILTGKTVSAMKAKKLGLIDRIVQPIGGGLKPAEENNYAYLEQIAVDVAKQLAAGTLKMNRKGSYAKQAKTFFLTKTLVFQKIILKKVRDDVLKMTAGRYPAPLKILDVVETGVTQGLDQGYLQESEEFGELSQTPQCKALFAVFNGRTECKKNKFGAAKSVETLGVIGAGLMGAGIAAVSIDKGIKTHLLDMNDKALARGENQIYKHYDGLTKKRRITDFQRHIVMSNLKPTLSYNNLNACDLVIEAVFEELSLKHKVIKQLEEVVPPHCVIATNTSALPISEIAKVSKRPEKVIGMHYFSPVEKMELLEVITSEKTSKETIAQAAQLGLAQGKLVVVVKDCPGFFVVRCLAPMLSEVGRLLQEGVSPDEIDQITKDYGFPVGAATLTDEVGLDVAQHVSEFLGKALGPRVGGGSVEVLSEMTALGYRGRKTGKGYFIYDRPKMLGLFGKKKSINDGALRVLEKYRLKPPSSVSGTADRQLRILCRYVNEAAHCLQEGVISSPADGDTASVFGIGFPPFWGGPFRFVDQFGAEKLVTSMTRYADSYSEEQFKPAQIILDHAKNNTKFHAN